MSNLTLLIIQAVCCTLTTVLALALIMSRAYMRNNSRSYEASRWMLIAAMLLFAVHYMLQMLFGFRARGADVGALINILFYSPIAYMIVYSTIRMASGQRYLRQYAIIGFSSNLLIMIVFVIGLLYYRSLHMTWALYIMETIHVATRILFVFHPASELRRVRRKVEEETGDDIEDYNLYMRTGTVLLYGTSLLTVTAIFSTRAIILLGPIFFLALIFYIVSFISLGFKIDSISEVIDDETLDSDMTEKEAQVKGLPESKEQLSPEEVQRVSQILEQWRAEGGYRVVNLTCHAMAAQLGLSKKVLTQYLAEQENKSFRIWLSEVRIEEVKRLLLSDHNYSNEAIANECGFSSRSWMQSKFKASTGLSPNEWKAKTLPQPTETLPQPSPIGREHIPLEERRSEE